MSEGADDLQGLRGVIVEALALALEPLQQDIRELQADVSFALDKLDRLEGIETAVLDLKAHGAKVSREGMKDRDVRQALERRLSALERRLEAVERREGKS